MRTEEFIYFYFPMAQKRREVTVLGQAKMATTRKTQNRETYKHKNKKKKQ